MANAPLVLDDFEAGNTNKWSAYSGGGASVTFKVVSPGRIGSYAGRADYTMGSGWGGIQQSYSVSQNWSSSAGLRFWYNGSNNNVTMRVEVLDNRAAGSTTDTAERWVFNFVDNVAGWRQVSIPWTSFTRRGDWQPTGAPNDGFGRTQVWGFNISPTGGTGMFQVDQVELYK